MANIKSQIKRNKQNEAARVRNKGVRSNLKTEAKKVHTAAALADGDAATTALCEATRMIDKAAAKGALHKRAAARRKSRLTRQVNSALAG